jgi:hypothetical protein
MFTFLIARTNGTLLYRTVHQNDEDLPLALYHSFRYLPGGSADVGTIVGDFNIEVRYQKLGQSPGTDAEE